MSGVKSCPKCGDHSAISANFCMECGHPFAAPAPSVQGAEEKERLDHYAMLPHRIELRFEDHALIWKAGALSERQRLQAEIDELKAQREVYRSIESDFRKGLAEVRTALERFSPLVQHGPEDYRIRATALAKLDALMGEK